MKHVSPWVYAQAGDAVVRHFRTHRGDHQADLIIERDDGRIVAVEVKLGPTPDARAVQHLLWLGAVDRRRFGVRGRQRGYRLD